MSIELRRTRALARFQCGCRRSEFDGDSRRFLVDAVSNEGSHVLISGMAVQKEDAPKAVMDEALRGFEVDLFQGFSGNGDRARKAHMIRGTAGHDDRRDQDVGPL